ncbi:MAG TPA: hypothetical protein VN282_13695 [Pyrinomonadaceae bacterium]|nr:hypothetical protein [Pyrinomonadaceae bacterium]
MRFGAILVALTLFGTAAAQRKSKWVRVYTFDDAVIEMEEIQLSFGNFGRVRFRTVFKKPRPLPGKPGTKFKTVVEDLEIQCREQEYRLSSTVYLDAKGAPVHVYKAGGDEEWQELRSLMMQRLLDSACRMIEKKKL